MNIFITGGTGFIGTALCKALVAEGHQLTVLSRQSKTHTQAVRFVQHFANLDGVDAVINLAGEPIFAKAWRASQKQKLLNSRVQLTKKLAELIQQSDSPPKVLISGSATGYYGDLPAIAKNSDELTACGTAFPAQLCQQWENTAFSAQSEQTRVCVIRTGIVLNEKGGALKQMLPLYRLGLGGKLGNGQQHWAWISLEDHIRATLFLLNNPYSQGAYNLVAPVPVKNAEFNQLLAQSLNRPAFFSVPACALKFALGERSQLLLDNQPLVPNKLLSEGFEFHHQNIHAYFDKNKAS
ncbi:TIGR01777 family protein [Pasteurellaceae bacterium Orientalotternb1]|nr:TIGR01777 family protein [Pasteurellaceae bacterium Orientalotternb1]